MKTAYEWVEETVVFRKNQLNLWQSSVKEALLQSDLTPDNGFTLDHEGGGGPKSRPAHLMHRKATWRSRAS